jgi:lipid A 4'-phosphatase
VDFGVLFFLALATTLPFWLTDLDLAIMQRFYSPDHPDGPWPVGREPLFHFLYLVVPVLTVTLALGTLFIILGSRLSLLLRRWRAGAVLVLLGLLLGPGLLVNAVFKEHWGRDRPRQVETLGGLQVYHPPLVKVEAGEGKSFPCGHCSVAFVLGAFWLLWRRRYPQLALFALAASVTLGALVGIARMGAGGHFPSDVLWSAWFTWLALLAVYHFVLRMPERELAIAHGSTALDTSPMASDITHSGKSSPATKLAAVGYGILGLMIVIGTLLSIPNSAQFRAAISLDDLDPAVRELLIEARNATVQLVLVDDNEVTQIEIQGDFRGVGLPGNRVTGGYRFEARESGAPVLTFRVQEHGLFTELEGALTVRVPENRLDAVSVRLTRGDIQVEAADPEAARETLDLQTERGRILW